MHYADTTGRAAFRLTAPILIALSAVALLATTQPAASQGTGMPAAAAAEGEEAEIPHAFFTHMGLPEGVGKLNLRVLGISTRADGRTTQDSG